MQRLKDKTQGSTYLPDNSKLGTDNVLNAEVALVRREKILRSSTKIDENRPQRGVLANVY